MSTKTEAVFEEIKALSPQEFQALWQVVQQWITSRREPEAGDDPIRSARGMFTDNHLNDALIASRAEDRRRG
jgi:hypothetical protein